MHHLILVGLIGVTTDVHLNVILVLYIENTKLWTLIVRHLLPIRIEVKSLDLWLTTCSITDGHRLSKSTGLAIVWVILHWRGESLLSHRKLNWIEEATKHLLYVLVLLVIVQLLLLLLFLGNGAVLILVSIVLHLLKSAHRLKTPHLLLETCTISLKENCIWCSIEKHWLLLLHGLLLWHELLRLGRLRLTLRLLLWCLWKFFNKVWSTNRADRLSYAPHDTELSLTRVASERLLDWHIWFNHLFDVLILLVLFLETS